MTTPIQSPATAGRFGSNPSTPTKPGAPTQPQLSPSMAGGFEGSTGSTFSSPATTGSPRDALQAPFRGLFGAANASSAQVELQQLCQYVRADPALLTCFDPADKELYDLWVPKR